MDGAENFSLKIEKNGGKILPNAVKFLYEKELPQTSIPTKSSLETK
jgi:hypothetical protein